MRFLFLTQYFPPEIGATPARLSSISRELKKLGDDVEVVTAMPNHLSGAIFKHYRGGFYIHETLEGVSVHRTWVYVSQRPTIAGRLASYFSFALTSLWSLLRARRPDFLLVESPPLPIVVSAVIYSCLRRVPFILNVADLWPDAPRQLGVIRGGLSFRLALRLEAWAYRRARYVNAVTEGILDRLTREKSVPEDKLLLLPNGVDTTIFSPHSFDPQLERELGIGGRRVFLYAGTHGLAYDLGMLIDIAKKLCEYNLVFVLVGEGHTKSGLEQRVRELELDNVIFVDSQPLDQMSRFFRLAWASVIPLADNQLLDMVRPAKLFPSLACGTPVVYAGRGEGARIVKTAEAGLVVPPGDLNALQTAIITVLQDDSLRSLLALNARRYAEANSSWQDLVKNWRESLIHRSAPNSAGEKTHVG